MKTTLLILLMSCLVAMGQDTNFEFIAQKLQQRDSDNFRAGVILGAIMVSKHTQWANGKTYGQIADAADKILDDIRNGALREDAIEKECPDPLPQPIIQFTNFVGTNVYCVMPDIVAQAATNPVPLTAYYSATNNLPSTNMTFDASCSNSLSTTEWLGWPVTATNDDRICPDGSISLIPAKIICEDAQIGLRNDGVVVWRKRK